jgi:hypothetical protein
VLFRSRRSRLKKRWPSEPTGSRKVGERCGGGLAAWP